MTEVLESFAESADALQRVCGAHAGVSGRWL